MLGVTPYPYRLERPFRLLRLVTSSFKLTIVWNKSITPNIAGACGFLLHPKCDSPTRRHVLSPRCCCLQRNPKMSLSRAIGAGYPLRPPVTPKRPQLALGTLGA